MLRFLPLDTVFHLYGRHWHRGSTGNFPICLIKATASPAAYQGFVVFMLITPKKIYQSHPTRKTIKCSFEFKINQSDGVWICQAVADVYTCNKGRCLCCLCRCDTLSEYVETEHHSLSISRAESSRLRAGKSPATRPSRPPLRSITAHFMAPTSRSIQPASVCEHVCVWGGYIWCMEAKADSDW